MKYFKIRSESAHWCGAWHEIYVPAEGEENLEQLISYNEEYDLVSSDVEEVTEEEYLRYKD